MKEQSAVIVGNSPYQPGNPQLTKARGNRSYHGPRSGDRACARSASFKGGAASVGMRDYLTALCQHRRARKLLDTDFDAATIGCAVSVG